MAGLHLVANRLPVAFDDKLGWIRSPGGLVTGSHSRMTSNRVTSGDGGVTFGPDPLALPG